MTSKERVYKAIAGEAVDRVPVFLWYSAAMKKKMADHLCLAEDDVEEYLGNDIYQDWLSINKQMSAKCEPGETFVDEWSITWGRSGEYNTPVSHPMESFDAEQISAFPFPDPDAPERYEYLQKLIDTKKDSFIGADVSGSLFEPTYHLRGMEQFLCDLIGGEPEADILLDRIKDFTKRVAENALRMGANWIWLGDDYGTQISLIASVEMFRKYFIPRLKDIIDHLRTIRKDVIIAYHSCGAIYPIIGELYEIGINVINPLQESAAGIEHKKIREKFSDLTLFCGLDTQNFLLKSDPDTVYEKAVEKINGLSRGGHYIFGTSHTLQHDIPCENVLALCKAVNNTVVKQR